MQHSVAVALLYGAPKLADFAAEQIADPDLARLRALTRLTTDPDLTARYPAHFGASVEVETTDGASRSASVADAWGDSENPLSREALLAKFHALSAHAGLLRPQADGLVSAAFGLVDSRSPAPLRRALAAIRLPSA